MREVIRRTTMPARAIRTRPRAATRFHSSWRSAYTGWPRSAYAATIPDAAAAGHRVDQERERQPNDLRTRRSMLSTPQLGEQRIRIGAVGDTRR